MNRLTVAIANSLTNAVQHILIDIAKDYYEISNLMYYEAPKRDWFNNQARVILDLDMMKKNTREK